MSLMIGVIITCCVARDNRTDELRLFELTFKIGAVKHLHEKKGQPVVESEQQDNDEDKTHRHTKEAEELLQTVDFLLIIKKRENDAHPRAHLLDTRQKEIPDTRASEQRKIVRQKQRGPPRQTESSRQRTLTTRRKERGRMERGQVRKASQPGQGRDPYKSRVVLPVESGQEQRLDARMKEYVEQGGQFQTLHIPEVEMKEMKLTMNGNESSVLNTEKLFGQSYSRENSQIAKEKDLSNLIENTTASKHPMVKGLSLFERILHSFEESVEEGKSLLDKLQISEETVVTEKSLLEEELQIHGPSVMTERLKISEHQQMKSSSILAFPEQRGYYGQPRNFDLLRQFGLSVQTGESDRSDGPRKRDSTSEWDKPSRFELLHLSSSKHIVAGTSSVVFTRTR